MLYKQTTQVPNDLLDKHLALLSEVELKVYLVIARQTLGWLDKRTGKRKVRDRIYSSQFQAKTGFKRRIITEAIKSLVFKKLITVTEESGIVLCHPAQRRGKTKLYYGIAFAPTCAPACAMNAHVPAHNKTNLEKARLGFSGSISELIAQAPYLQPNAKKKSAEQALHPHHPSPIHTSRHVTTEKCGQPHTFSSIIS